jgi:hypothetical protein
VIATSTDFSDIVLHKDVYGDIAIVIFNPLHCEWTSQETSSKTCLKSLVADLAKLLNYLKPLLWVLVVIMATGNAIHLFWRFRRLNKIAELGLLNAVSNAGGGDAIQNRVFTDTHTHFAALCFSPVCLFVSRQMSGAITSFGMAEQSQAFSCWQIPYH